MTQLRLMEVLWARPIYQHLAEKYDGMAYGVRKFAINKYWHHVLQLQVWWKSVQHMCTLWYFKAYLLFFGTNSHTKGVLAFKPEIFFVWYVDQYRSSMFQEIWPGNGFLQHFQPFGFHCLRSKVPNCPIHRTSTYCLEWNRSNKLIHISVVSIFFSTCCSSVSLTFLTQVPRQCFVRSSSSNRSARPGAVVGSCTGAEAAQSMF